MSGLIPIKSLSVLFCAALLLLPTAAIAAIYGYVDEQGVMHFTNAPIDGRYRPMRAVPPKRARQYSAEAYDGQIRAAAQRFRIDPLLIKAVIRAESCFDCQAVSKKGAQGLMQLMPETARDMGVDNPFDPADNIRGGTRYLRKLLDLFKGNLRLALAAYNAGPERVRLLGRVPHIQETVEYIERVMHNYRQYQAAAPAGKKMVTVAYD